MTMITPSYLGETIEYSSLHACRSTLEDPTVTGLGVADGAGNSLVVQHFHGLLQTPLHPVERIAQTRYFVLATHWQLLQF